MMKRLLMMMIALCCFHITQAQQRECATNEVHERLLKTDAAYAQRQAAIESLTAEFMKNPDIQRQENGQIIIPCIVHVVYANTAQNISAAQVQSQIDRLNQDYAASNSDYNSVPSTFTNVRSGDTDIRFELIEVKRYSNSRAEWGTNDAVKSSYPPIEPARILNMWVANIGGGILGYAQFPGGSPSTDGVVMSPQYFGDATVSGSGSFNLSAPFDRGRTATHEVGHWLNLRHIWGDGNCNQDDFVSDTPAAGNPNYGCPSAGTNSCSGGQSDMFMNYMDYVDDACMFMFSGGQDARMQATFSSNGGRGGFLLNPAYTPGGGGGTTCNDTEVTFALTTDQYGSETTWTIKEGNTTVASGSGYGANQSYTETACLPNGDYIFTINDSYGDGICCQYGNGSYALTDGATTLASGATFTTSESTNFTIGTTAPAPCDTPTGLGSSNITQTGFTLSWAAVTGAVSYDVTVNGTSLNSTTNSITVTGAAAGTIYTCAVRTNCAENASSFSGNISVTTQQNTALSCSSTISTFPYNENFESNLGAWTQGSGDDLNWTRDASGTPSGSTGPSNATQGTFYMYVEASSPNYPSKVTYLDGPCFDLSGADVADFTFDYHMYGSNMGSLVLQAQTTAGNWTNLWSRSGDQGNAWDAAAVDMSAYIGQTVKVRFVGTTGNGFRSDMAIDNVSLSTSAGGGSTAVNVSITFDNYPEETSWQIKSGSTVVASGGTYASQADGSTINVPVDLSTGCYDFVITDAYGDGICCSYGNGSFTVTAGSTVLASGSSFASSQTTSFCVGSGARTTGGSTVSEGLAPAGFNTYPNPVSNKLNIFTGKMETSQFTITSTEGRVWMNGTISQQESTIDLSELAIGMYILSINDGENVIVRRIIKN
jgi:hypothetical protein